MEKPDMANCSDKEWTKWYWGEFNETCKICINVCKQSHIVTLSCAKFNRKGN